MVYLNKVLPYLTPAPITCVQIGNSLKKLKIPEKAEIPWKIWKYLKKPKIPELILSLDLPPDLFSTTKSTMRPMTSVSLWQCPSRRQEIWKKIKNKKFILTFFRKTINMELPFISPITLHILTLQWQDSNSWPVGHKASAFTPRPHPMFELL